MSGHSHWATIRRKKGAADAKRGQVFTRLAREIAMAARAGGGDPSTNVGLELAIERARAQNMPKDNIERAIKRGTGESREGGELEQVVYEGYANHGIALMIEVVTDNRNRAVAEIRHALTRNGGSMAEAGAVGWQFTRAAYFSFPAEGQDQNKVFELAVEAGADDVVFDENMIEIVGPVDSFKAITDALTGGGIQPEEAGLKLIPKNEIQLDADDTVQVMRTIETLEELDDVQEVFSNLTITEEAIAKLEGA
jgi:YebC/PmpR family DNA-binding regulatory protein